MESAPKNEQEVRENIDFLFTLPKEKRNDHEKNPLNHKIGTKLLFYTLSYLDQKYEEDLNQSISKWKKRTSETH
jgi:hypothetical protein